jgi:hypothetical protein
LVKQQQSHARCAPLAILTPSGSLPQERLRNIKRAHGTRSLGEVTVDQALGSMRAIPVSHRHTRTLEVIRTHDSRAIFWRRHIIGAHAPSPFARPFEVMHGPDSMCMYVRTCKRSFHLREQPAMFCPLYLPLVEGASRINASKLIGNCKPSGHALGGIAAGR